MKRFLCWIGIHRVEQTKPLITMQLVRCVNCKKEFVETLYGLMDI